MVGFIKVKLFEVFGKDDDRVADEEMRKMCS